MMGQRGDCCGRTAGEANGNERGGAECMCIAGDLGKVRRGIEQDRAREERVILFRASKSLGS